MTDVWEATLTADQWECTVTEEAWESNDFPGVQFVTQVVHSGAVEVGTSDQATVDAVALTNFTVSTLTLSALNASITSTVAVNDTVLIAGGSDAGTYTVTQSGAPCLTIIDPQPTTVRVDDVAAGAVWYVLVGAVWVPHATVQALAEAAGSYRATTAVADGVDPDIGSITELTADGGYVDFNVVLCPASAEGKRCAVVLPYDLTLAEGQEVLVIGVPSDEGGTTAGPSVGQRIPALAGSVGLSFANIDPEVYDFSGTPETVTVTVDGGTPQVFDFDQDYGDLGGFMAALVPVLTADGVTAVAGDYANPVTVSVTSGQGALVSNAPGASSSVEVVASGALAAWAAAFFVDETTGIAAGATRPPNYLQGILDGWGDLGDEEGFGSPTHAWTDDSLAAQHHSARFMWTGTSWVTSYRKMRPEELVYGVLDEADWDPVPTNIRSAVDQIAGRVKDLEDAPGGSGSGDVVGPTSSTEGYAVEFDGTTGKLLQQANLTGAGGRPKLDGDGTWADNLIPSTIARDSEVTSAISALSSVYQPIDSDLTAIAALTTTSYGRAFLALADAAAGRTALGLGTAALSASGDFQPIDSDLTAIAALTTTSFGRSLLAAADASALRTLAGIGSTVLAPTIVTSTTVGSGGTATLSASSLTSYTRLKLTIIGQMESTSIDRETINLTFNGDTGSNYSTGGGALTTAIAIGELPCRNTNTDRAGMIVVDIGSVSGWWTDVLMLGSTVRSAATVSRTNNGFAVWSGSVSAALASLSIVGTSDFAQGTRFTVEGIA